MEKVLRKFWLFIVFGLTTTVFFSCEKDDNKLENENNPFVGTWGYYEPDYPSDSGTVTFNKDKTLHWLSKADGIFASGTYSYSEKDKTLTVVLTDGKNTVTWTWYYVFMGKDLILTGKDASNYDDIQMIFTRQ